MDKVIATPMLQGVFEIRVTTGRHRPTQNGLIEAGSHHRTASTQTGRGRVT
jgi:hypothetical protein